MQSRSAGIRRRERHRARRRKKRTEEIGQVLNQLLSDRDFLALNQHDREIVIDAIRSSSDPSFDKLNDAFAPELITKILKNLKARGLIVLYPPVPPGVAVKVNPSDFVPLTDLPEDDCNLEYSPASSRPISETGQKIYDELSRREERWDNAETLSVLIVLLLSAPRVWYFLLDRLAEISAAIRGTRS